MSKAKDLTAQVTELYKKHTEEMRDLEEQREQALKEERFDEAAQDLHDRYKSFIKAGFNEDQAWKMIEIFFTNSTKEGIF